ncbi:MAG: hypothetical protein ABEJ36_00135 [Candidatus Nanosalina sp.]
MTGSIPSTKELYKEATRVSDQLEEQHSSGEWGSQPNHESLSNFFVWDVQPDRFFHEDNVPDEIVVLPNVYGAFLNGTGFNLETPLSDEGDREDVEAVLGEDIVENFYDDLEGVREVDTPRDVMDMHYLADSLDIDVYRLPGSEEYLGSWVQDSGDEVLEDWRETADIGFDSFLTEYTRPAQGRFFPEAGKEFSGNEEKTAFVMYANRDSDRFSEQPIDDINKEYNRGGMAYHTPKTMNMLLRNSMLEE